MIGNIVVFSDHFMHSLIDIVEESSLTTGLFCVSNYVECLELVETIPNLLGVLIIDWKPTMRTMRFYKDLFKRCDHIAECRDSPLTISILYRVTKSHQVFSKIRTNHLYVYAMKLKNLTDECLKLDGLGPIFGESQGLFHVESSFAINPSKIEFDSDYFNTVVFSLLDDEYEIPYVMQDKHPLLRSIQNYRNGDLKEEDLRGLLEHTPFAHIHK